MFKWIKLKLRAWLRYMIEIDEDMSRIARVMNDVERDILRKSDARFRELETEADRISKLSNRNKDKVNKTIQRMDSIMSQLSDTSKAMSDVYQTVESVVSIGADIQPDMNHDRSWAVVCVEGKMNIVKSLPLDYNNARDMLRYLNSFPTSKSVYDTPPYFKNFGW